MSYIKICLVFSLVSILLFTNCEDTHSKKNTATPEKKETSKVTPEQKKVSPLKDTLDTTTDTVPVKITNQNVREFLTAYGKEHKETQVRITTTFGVIDLELYNETPLHRANFIHLVKEKYFDKTFFYRVSKGFLIQGGNSDRKESGRLRRIIGEYKIPQEQLPSLTHTRGALAAAKQWVDNPSDGSNPYEFFIVVNGRVSHHLDKEHTIFGRVLEGMKVADTISKLPVDESEWPLENVFIKAEIIK